ncbi:hypothetical protein CRE_24965 [Caenorhabditis remanei]|uniref:Uncharacterized protein n=1 Tax=Caenorhabditis remanei TaxID=31234 RepID=E3MHN4_CAERE|nr:hypothetical protein CRE_24965 [Caenorhabditis remanei]
MEIFHLFPILFFLFSPVFSREKFGGEEVKPDELRSFARSDGDELPIPSEIPEKIKKFCEKDPSYEFCIKLGLGKKDKFSKNRFSTDSEEEEITVDDMAETREDEEEEVVEDDASTGIDCELEPLHPGCQRTSLSSETSYFDAFIAWKIQKDCEVRPDGKFCRCLENSESSDYESSPSTTTSTPKPSLNLSDILRRILEAVGGRAPESTPESTTTTPEPTTTPESAPESSESVSGLNLFADLLRTVVEMEHNSHRNCDKNTPESVASESSPESSPQLDKFIQLLVQVMKLQHEMARNQNQGKAIPESVAPESSETNQDIYIERQPHRFAPIYGRIPDDVENQKQESSAWY